MTDQQQIHNSRPTIQQAQQSRWIIEDRLDDNWMTVGTVGCRQMGTGCSYDEGGDSFKWKQHSKARFSETKTQRLLDWIREELERLQQPVRFEIAIPEEMPVTD